MKKYMLFLIPLLSFALIGCNRGEERDEEDEDSISLSSDSQNAFKNDPSSVDLDIAQKINKMLQNDALLSPIAKNVKIDVLQGKVTLRGTVSSEKGKLIISNKIRQISGVKNIENKLEVSSVKQTTTPSPATVAPIRNL
jgi:osmotically-inducible protein OsmY